MPQHVAQGEQAAAVVAGKDVAVGVQIGDVVDVHGQPPLGACGDVTRGLLHGPEVGRERVLLLVGDDLLGEDQHAVLVDRGLDGRGVGRGNALGDVDASHPRCEERSLRVDALHVDGHVRTP